MGRLIDGVNEQRLTVVITFINFKKAFDTIIRGKMLKILSTYGIPVRFVEGFRLLQKQQGQGCVTRWSIIAGVLKGDTLAPYSVCNNAGLTTA